MKSAEDKFNKKSRRKGMKPIPKKGEDETTGYNVNRKMENDDKTGAGMEEFIDDNPESGKHE